MTDFPRLATIAPGQSFADVLAAEVLERFAQPNDPMALADVLILLPTRRSVRTLTEALGRQMRQRGHTTMILPRISPIGDVDEDELVLQGAGEVSEAALTIPPAISDLDRAFALASLVRQRFDGQGYPPDPERDLAMGKSLGRFLDTAIIEQVSLDGLDALVPEEFAEHWQDSLTFLEIIRDYWPDVLAARGMIDSATRRNLLLKALADKWAATPPRHPVIAAGSTGSIPATAALLKVIANMPGGSVVLPGLDVAMSEATWVQLEDSHPQCGLKFLLQHLEAPRDEVESLGSQSERAEKRRVLINEALRPSAATDGWINAIKTIDQRTACEGLNFLVARHSGEEATAIALLFRETVETPGRTAALVTPDRTLARRVAAEARRFSLEIDDSAGLPLHQAPPAHHIEALMEAVAKGWDPVGLLTVLKSPFTRLGRPRAELRHASDILETLALRNGPIASGFEHYRAALEALMGETKHDALKSRCTVALDLLDDLRAALAPLTALTETGADFAAWTSALTDVAINLAQDETGSADELWRGTAGETLSDVLSTLRAAPDDLGPLMAADFAAMFKLLLREHVVRARGSAHPRLFIWGPLEARLQQADVMILGGLTESIWPMDVGLDPWLSRQMRETLQLSPPERRIGQSAHDFAQLASSPHVVLTRSEKVDGQPAVPSRWWLRLEMLLKGTELGSIAPLMLPHAHWAQELGRPKSAATPVKPPQPRPPVAARPTRFSVTEIETWIRDPYALYAKRVLGLRPLDPLMRTLGGADRGTLIHKILDEFVQTHPAQLGERALDDLIRIGRAHFEPLMSSPDVAALWWPRFERLAAWFIEQERDMRADLRQVLTEQEGKLSFDVDGATYTLNARADRIEVRHDNTGVIVDYKTGYIPKLEECETGLSPQVTLEAAMATRGAFPAPVPQEISALTYIGLRGNRDLGEVRPMTTSVEQTVDWSEHAFENLLTLIRDFQRQDRPYPSQPRPQFQSSWGDYDHLARRLEWSIGSEGGGEGGAGD